MNIFRTSTTGGSPAGPAWVPGWLVDLLIIILVIVVAFMPGPRPPGAPRGSATIVVLVAIAVATVPLRRIWPVPSLAVGVGLYATSALLDRPSMAIGIAVIVSAYSVGQLMQRRVAFTAGAIATSILTVLSLTVSVFGVIEPRIFQIAAATAVATAFGDSSRSHREFLQAATERAERAEQTREAEAQRRIAQERLRIAQDLHDTVAHQISVISLSAGVASGALETNPEKAQTALGTIRESARAALTDIGDLLRYLRTDAQTPTEPPQPGTDDLPTLIDRVVAAGLDVTIEQDGDLARIGGSVAAVVYRIVQEGLTNAHKHGSGQEATVRISVLDDEVTVTVANPISPKERNQQDPPHGGLGLTGIRERVKLVRGTVSAGAEGDSFSLTAHLPLRREEAS